MIAVFRVYASSDMHHISTNSNRSMLSDTAQTSAHSLTHVRGAIMWLWSFVLK